MPMRGLIFCVILLGLAGCLTVRKAHLNAWRNQPVESLDTQPFFLSLPMTRTFTGSGMEIRTYRNGRCNSIFYIKSQKVIKYVVANTSATVGCMTDARVLPAKRFDIADNSQEKAPYRPNPGPSSKRNSSGTGFIITADGLILTNNHVVRGCSSIRVQTTGHQKPHILKIARVDKKNDLALLDSSATFSNIATFRGGRSIRAGEDIVVVGYLLPSFLTNDLGISKGNISALAGPGDDPSLIQINAPLQPGNSGGPILDTSGNVVGVVVSSLDAVNLARRANIPPQNVNFGVSAGTARSFLESQNVSYKTHTSTEVIPTPNIATEAQKFTVLIE